MSRSSAKTLRIALAPGEAALLRGTDSRVLAAPERSAASLLPLLDSALAEPAWRGRRAEVVLSQHFVRQVITLPPGKALSRAEEAALVGAALREIYGDEVDAWRIEVHSQPPQHGLFGVAVDTALVEQLDALLARHGFRDVSIRPLVSAAARRLPNRLDGWWALVEPGWLSLFGAAKGVWQHASAQPIDDGWPALLPELIAREAPGDTQPTVWIQALGVGTVTAPAARQGRWQVLPHDDRTHGALALAGI